jgi:hypothetical protein
MRRSVAAALDRLGRKSRAAVTRGLLTALEAASGRSPVVVPEYPLRPRPRWGWTADPPAELVRRVAAPEQEYARVLDEVLALRCWCGAIPRERVAARSGALCWDDDYWGGLDAVAQVAFLRSRDPAVYIEVGSGRSTRFARRAVRDFGLRTTIVSIDPEPREGVDDACDEVLRQPLEEVDLQLFRRLGAGDVLLVDGTHTAFMNSDATVLFCEVLPTLATGVLVGIHDVFLPWDYPPTWERRFYGEQYLLATFLLGGAEGWALRLAGWYVTRLSPLAARLDPLWPMIETRFGRAATSLWMERT